LEYVRRPSSPIPSPSTPAPPPAAPDRLRVIAEAEAAASRVGKGHLSHGQLRRDGHLEGGGQVDADTIRVYSFAAVKRPREVLAAPGWSKLMGDETCQPR
jgi:hypothetical protein